MVNRKIYSILVLIVIAILAVGLCGCYGTRHVTIGFDTAGGGSLSPLKVTGDLEKLELPVPTKTGYTFAGWYYDSALEQPVDTSVIPTENTTFFAKWDPNRISITFDADGKKQYIYVNYGEDLTLDMMPAVPEKEGYIGTWETTTIKNVTEMQTVYAVYKESFFTVKYYLRDELYASFSGNKGAEIDYPQNPVLVEEEKEYFFFGWYYDESFTEPCEEKITQIGTADITLYAYMVDITDMERYFTYSVNDGEATVTGLTALGKNQRLLVVPDTLGGATVTTIASGVGTVIDATNQVTVALPSTVKSIGAYAFYGVNINTLYLNEGLEYIGEKAFAGCENLLSVTIPSSVRHVASGAFENNSGLNSFVFSPESKMETLDSLIFVGDYSLKSIVLPDNDYFEFFYDTFINCGIEKFECGTEEGKYVAEDGVLYSREVIQEADEETVVLYKTLYLYPFCKGGNYKLNTDTEVVAKGAFYGNEAITGVEFSANTKNIQKSAFANCKNLSLIVFYEGLLEIGDYAFTNCAVTDLNIPSTVNIFGEKAFFGSQVANVVFADGENSATLCVEQNAFGECKNLYSLTLPQRLEKIEKSAFMNCSSLLQVNFSAGSVLTEISDYAFAYCDSITSLTIPTSVKIIGSYAFYGSIGSTLEPSLPRGLEYIGDYAFANTRVTTYQSNSTTRISYLGKGAFQNCRSLVQVQFSSYVDFNTISDYAFYGCISLSNLIFNGNIKKIGDYAFYGCTNLTNVTFSQGASGGIEEIGDSSFENCKKLRNGGGTSAILPQTLLSLGQRAFFGCESLVSVSIPKNLSAISKEAFAYCTALESITYITDCVTDTLEENCFAYCTSLHTAQLPSKLALREEGKGAVKNPFYGCSNLTAFTIFDNDNLVYSKDGVGEGIVYIKTDDYYGIYLYPTGKVGAFVVDTDIYTIDDYAFYGVSGLTRLSFNTKVPVADKEDVLFVKIGNYAFSQSSVAEVDISYRVIEVGDYAFAGSRLTKAEISDTVVVEGAKYAVTNTYNDATDNLLTIGLYAFYNTEITEVNIPKRVTEIKEGAFYDCGKIKSITFANDYPGLITVEDKGLTVGDKAFYNGSSITAIVISARITEIGNSAFENCRNIQSIIFEENDMGLTVGEYAFAGNHYVYSVTLPSSIVSLGKGVFYDCSRLSQAIFPDYVNSGSLAIPDYAFYACFNLIEIDIPKYVSLIGAGAFKNSNVTRLVFDEIRSEGIGLTIGVGAFEGASSLQEISLPYRLKKISENAFRSSGLSVLSMSDGEEFVVEDYAFANTLLTDVNIVERMNIVGKGVFADTTLLTAVLYEGEDIVVAESTFENSGIENILFNGSVASIDKYAFKNTANLTEVSIFAQNILAIGDNAFYSSGLSSIVVENADRITIGKNAFYLTGNLREITFSSESIAIDDYAFAQSGLSYFSVNSSVNSADDIGVGILYGCTDLSEILFVDNNGFYNTKEGVLYREGEESILWQYPAGKKGAVFVLGEEVTTVAPYAFYGNNYLTTVTIPQNDKTVVFGEEAFGKTDSKIALYVDIAKVDSYNTLSISVKALQNGFNGFVLENIGNNKYAVVGYTGTESEIYINGKMTVGGVDYNIVKIARNAFYNNFRINKVTIGAGISDIEEYAFAFASNLQEVVIGDNVITIKGHVFEGCSQLKTVLFGNNVSAIKNYAFYNCSELETVDLSDSPVKEIGTYAFGKCGLKNLLLGSGLQTIQNNAFEDNKELISVRLPETVDYIGDYVFRGCDSLIYMFVEANVVPTLKSDASFAMTPNSLKIFVSSYAEHLYKSSSAWRKYSAKILSYDNISTVSGFENYVLKANSDGYTLVYYLGIESDVIIRTDIDGFGKITETGEYAFSHFVETVILHEGIKRIGKNSFRNSINMTAISIPDSVESIGSYAFYSLQKLQYVVLGETCNLQKVGMYAFAECKEMQEIVLPSKVNDIGDYAFYDIGLQSAVVKSTSDITMSIGKFAFANNPDLTTLTFDCVLSRIGEGAFAENINLQSLYFNSTKAGIAQIDEEGEAFKNCDLLCIYVPTEAKMYEYKGSNGWSSQLDKNKLVVSTYISREGFVISLLGGALSAAIISYIGEDTNVIFPNVVDGYNIVRIGRDENNAEVTNGTVINNTVTEITIPSSVKNITGDAFRGAKSLKKVTFFGVSTLSEIGHDAFAYCENLEEVFIPKSVIYISNYAFYGDKKLKTVVFDEYDLYVDSYLTIGNYAFSETGIQEITLPKHLTTIEKFAFYKSNNLKNVNFSVDGLATSIGESCFAYTAIESIVLPESMSSVGSKAFAYCAELKAVYLNRVIKENTTSLTTAYADVFNGIESPFVKVYVPDSSYGMYRNAQGWSVKTVIPDLTAEGYTNGAVTGEMFNYRVNGTGSVVSNANTVTVTAYLGNKTEITVPRSLKIGNFICNITTIDAYFGNEEVKKISFASDSEVTNLNAYAFAGCKQLQTVIMSDKIAVANEYVFSQCVSLINVTLSASLSEISQYSFFECTALKEITVPAGVKNINNAAFMNCSSLNRLNIMFRDVTVLGMSAFTGTGAGMVIIVPEGREDAFRNQWNDWAGRIYDRSCRYGDFVLVENSTGLTLVQYNGLEKYLDLDGIVISGKKITSVAQNAFPNGTQILQNEQ